MVNLARLSAFLPYTLQSISYKPIPVVPGTLALNGYPLGQGASSHTQGLSNSLSQTHTAAQSPDCYVEPYNPPPIEDQDFPPFDPNLASIYRYRQQQGVNLGSWFVHERWMTPSVFECAGAAEADIPYGWGSQDNARAVLERHWDTFIAQSDFHYLATIGINTIRLPIGYWSLGPDFAQGTTFERVSQVYANSWSRIKRAIKQAGAAGIGVLVDLHGAVGSQNGHDHSGVSDGKTTLFSSQENMDKTIAVLTFLTKQLVTVSNVVGIQVLNEPVYHPELENFYSRAIAEMRAVSPDASKFPIYLHDAFDLDRFTNFVASRSDFVVQDHHSYFVFSPYDQTEPASQHTIDVKGAIAESFLRASNRVRRNMIIGEWSCALTPQSLADEGNAAQIQRDFCEQQMNVYANTTAGWTFWAYNLEHCEDANPGWCFKNVVGKSLPSSFTSKTKRALVDGIDDPTRNRLRCVLNRRQDRMDDSKKSHLGSCLPNRFEAIHQQKMQTNAGANSDSSNPAQRSFSKGYADGFDTARKFAAVNKSKLGFTGQFIQDAIASGGTSVVVPGTEENYGQGFKKGLAEGEARFL